jgi:hypothetical protein
MVWPAPPSIVRDLRSDDDYVRRKALLRIGSTEAQTRFTVYAKDGSIAGEAIARPDQVELRYAPLGSTDTEQAIVAIQLGGQYTIAAVATPEGNGWKRIASFGCWCKYDTESILETFVSLVQAPGPMEYPYGERYELVLRASGGGTGIYTQNEVHFRLYKGEMKPVISFVSRLLSWIMGDTQHPSRERIERRWFESGTGILIEGRAESTAVDASHFRIHDLDVRYLKTFTCRQYRWNQDAFAYELVAGVDPCAAKIDARTPRE